MNKVTLNKSALFLQLFCFVYPLSLTFSPLNAVSTGGGQRRSFPFLVCLHSLCPVDSPHTENHLVESQPGGVPELSLVGTSYMGLRA